MKLTAKADDYQSAYCTRLKPGVKFEKGKIGFSR